MRDVPVKTTLSHPEGTLPHHWSLGARRRSRTSSRSDARRRRIDASRSALVEHPFGTLKCRAGYRHFLVRGFNKVRGEWSLMALCYNFSRVLAIIGLDDLIAYFAQRAADVSLLRLRIAATAARNLLMTLPAQ